LTPMVVSSLERRRVICDDEETQHTYQARSCRRLLNSSLICVLVQVEDRTFLERALGIEMRGNRERGDTVLLNKNRS
jgi:hypothetical protein